MKTLQEIYFKENLITEMPQYSNFEDWVKSMGGIEGVMNRYGINLDDQYYYMREDYEDDEEGQQEFEEAAFQQFEEEMEDKFYDWIDSYAQDFPLELYRASCVDSPEDINFDATGEFWTDNLGSAECYWAPNTQTAEKDQYTIKALAEEKDIDWDSTLEANMDPNIGENENEFTLKTGAKVKIIGLEDPEGDWIEMNRLATI